MKTRKMLLMAIALLLALGSTGASAKIDKGIFPSFKPRPRPVKAPEITVEKGTTAVALLSGVLLLLGDRQRRRQR